MPSGPLADPNWGGGAGKSYVSIGFHRNSGTDSPREGVQLLLVGGSYGPL